jgi:T5SS/PEP-CTERM-associated repeat protein
MFIGGEDGGNGKLEVGSGSQLTLQGVDTFGGAAAFLQVGDAGHGEADVDGGRILIDGAGGTSPGLIVGGEELAAGSGQVSVSNGGEIDITGNQSFLAVGRNGNGTLDLTGGSKVVLDNSDGKAAGFVGVSPTSIGTVVVDGANSLLDSGNRLNIGFDLDLNPGGTGTVSVRNGGVIKATETHVGLNGFLGGNGQVAGSVFNDGGTVAPGLSPGTLTVAVDYTQTAGLLEIQIGGLAPGQFDVLNVSGDANFLGGSILFSFVDGFLPQTGDLVDFLVANSISGLENADFLFKGVAPGFQLDVQNTGSALRFVAESNAAAVPEPTTLAVVVTGLIGLLVVRRRRRSQNPYPREVSC